jgi:hypothetical protein
MCITASHNQIMVNTPCFGTRSLEPIGKLAALATKELIAREIKSYMYDYKFFFYFLSTYNPKDRVNPKSQLDPQTGKSLGYIESKAQ